MEKEKLLHFFLNQFIFKYRIHNCFYFYSRGYMMLMLALTASHASSLSVSVQRHTDWWQGSVHYFNGYCDLPIDKTYNVGQVSVSLVLDTPSDSIQVTSTEN